MIGRRCKLPANRDAPARDPAADTYIDRVDPNDGFTSLIQRPDQPNAHNEYSQQQCANYLGISERTLRDAIRDGKRHPPFKRRFGRRWFNLDELNFWIASDAMNMNADGKQRKMAEAA